MLTRTSVPAEPALHSSTSSAEIWVVLPAYNEEDNLDRLVSAIQRTLEARNYHVLVVDDGSRDRTAEAALAASEHAPVQLLQHKVNQGLGVTIRDGLREASLRAGADAVIVTMDSDLTHDPALIPRMLERIEAGADVVTASRYQPGAKVVGLSLYRSLLSAGAKWMFRLMCPIPGVREYTSGFRAYRAEVVRRAFAELGEGFVETSGFDCQAEILVKLRTLGIRFGEVPMILRYDLKGGPSKMNVLETVRRTAGLALRARQRLQ